MEEIFFVLLSSHAVILLANTCTQNTCLVCVLDEQLQEVHLQPNVLY